MSDVVVSGGYDYDDALLAAMEETSVREAPHASERADLWTRAGYDSPESLANVIGVPAETIRNFSEGRACGLFEPTLRKLAKVVGRLGR